MTSRNHWMFSVKIAMPLVFLMAISGCHTKTETPGQVSSTSKSETTFEPIVELSADQEKQKQQAVAAKDKLFASLVGELTRSMGENGPAKSIDVCKIRAPEIAATVSKETGVRIGRTSFKLRNKANTAPDWAAKFVQERTEVPTQVALPNSELGVLLPIRLKATCIVCHGTDDQIQPDVKVAIASNYPGDTATGFKEGDVRGYFWIEVPGQK